LCVSAKDADILSAKEYQNVMYLPVFIPTEWYNERALNITEKYCLYQGDLSIATNVKMVEALIKDVFNKLPFTFIIAGKNPPEKLVRKVSAYKHIKIIVSPGSNEMEQLIANAHINILPSQNTTGVKLKLLNALFNGKYCITDKASAEAIQLHNICSTANNAEEITEAIKMLDGINITEKEIKERKETLKRIYNNEKSASIIIELIAKKQLK